MSPIKEPNYFTSIDFPKDFCIQPIRDKKKYLKLFKNVKDETAIGEASPLYLYDPQSAKLIHETVPYSHIIMILRDPVTRAFSHYLMNRRGLETRSFHDAIHRNLQIKGFDLSSQYLELGLYYEQVKRYLKLFGSRQVKILIFEEFIRDEKEKVKKVIEFLGMENNLNNLVIKKYNPLAMPRGKLSEAVLHNRTIRKSSSFLMPYSLRKKFVERFFLTDDVTKPQMSLTDKVFLQDLYREDVVKLQDLLGKSLPWLSVSR